MTISALLMRKFRETEALVFSFLLSVPVSIASFAYFVVFGEVVASVGMTLLAIAVFSSFIFGYLSMSVLVKIAKNANFSGFCMFFGSLAVFLALFLWTGLVARASGADGQSPNIVRLIDSEDLIVSQFGNGLTVIVQEDHSTELVSINAFVRAGAIAEQPVGAGLSHLLEHLVMGGSTGKHRTGDIP